MKRYAVTIDMYVNNEEEANQIAKEINDKYDNQAKVVSVTEAPYGKIGENK
jgi:hypothetical protein